MEKNLNSKEKVITMNFTVEELKSLYNWSIYQRVLNKKGKLLSYRIEKLKKINFVFQINGVNLLKDGPLFKEIHPTKNPEIDLLKLSSGTKKKIWWLGGCGHEWDADINSRTNGRGCPCCSGRRVCNDNCLATKNPELAKEWHPDKNRDLTPNDVTVSSNKKVWWLGECGHEWDAVINDRTNGIGCPYCSGRRVCNDNCLTTKNPELAKEWHPTKNGKLTPNNVTVSSNKKVWWQGKCGHEWDAVVYNRTNGTGCPCCYGKKACSDNCLKIRFPDIAKMWDKKKNGNLTPNDITAFSNKGAWWKTPKGKSRYASVNSMVNDYGKKS